MDWHLIILYIVSSIFIFGGKEYWRYLSQPKKIADPKRTHELEHENDIVPTEKRHDCKICNPNYKPTGKGNCKYWPRCTCNPNHPGRGQIHVHNSPEPKVTTSIPKPPPPSVCAPRVPSYMMVPDKSNPLVASVYSAESDIPLRTFDKPSFKALAVIQKGKVRYHSDLNHVSAEEGDCYLVLDGEMYMVYTEDGWRYLATEQKPIQVKMPPRGAGDWGPM